MVKVTIQVPEELALRLEPVQDRLAEVIELGLREIESAQYELHNEVIEFLASGPSPEAIVSFRPSEKAQARVAELLEKNQKGTLSTAEEAELDQYEDLDYLMALVKARARQHLSKAA
ncbi:MAG: hypothetical protein MAG451_01152 [Anaerolineales bacterium]|nr:hypothetical protein [Anaerolineales bacterium]